jgi:hypothetical protein
MCHITGATSGAGTVTEYMCHITGATSGSRTVTEGAIAISIYIIINWWMTGYGKIC